MRTDWLKLFDLEDRSQKLVERNRKRYEQAVWYPLLVSGVLAVLGGTVALVDFRGTGVVGFYLFALASLGLAVSIGLSRPIDTFRVLYKDISGGSRYDTRRFWGRLKTAGIFLNLLTVGGAGVLLVAILSRFGVVEIGTIPYEVLLRAGFIYAVVFFTAIAYTVYLTLRTPIERQVGFLGFENLFFYLAILASALLALTGGVLAAFPLDIARVFVFRPTDAPVFMLAATTFLGAAAFAGRSPPTIRILFTDEREYYAGAGRRTRSSVLLPTLLAFTLLFGVVLAIFVFGVGIASFFEEVPRNTLVIGVFGFIVLALASMVGVGYMLSRSQDTHALFKQRRSMETRKELTILGASAAVTALFLGVSAWLYTGRPLVGFPPERWLDFFSFGLLAALGPYGFYVHARYRRRKALEERFPDFLRDIAASNRAGLTLPNAVKIAAKGEYAALSPEIVKMADQLSWDVPFIEALERFGQRVRTPLVERAVNLIMEASRAGGNVTDVLMAAATDAREIKNLENERRSTMVMYVAIIYITFLVFLATTAVLYATFIPQLVAAGAAITEGGLSGFGPVSFNLITIGEYRTFYYLAALVQGVGNGFVAGLIESGSALNGMRHSFVMVLITWITFTIVLL